MGKRVHRARLVERGGKWTTRNAGTEVFWPHGYFFVRTSWGHDVSNRNTLEDEGLIRSPVRIWFVMFSGW